MCPRACRLCVCFGCVGVRRGSLPGGVQHAVNRALLRIHNRETEGTGVASLCSPTAILYLFRINLASRAKCCAKISLEGEQCFSLGCREEFIRRVRVLRVRADSKTRVSLSSSWPTSVSCMCDYASASGWFRDKTTEIRSVVSFVKATRCSLYWCRDECFRQRSLNRITRRRCDGGPISVESKREIGKCSRRPTFPW